MRFCIGDWSIIAFVRHIIRVWLKLISTCRVGRWTEGQISALYWWHDAAKMLETCKNLQPSWVNMRHPLEFTRIKIHCNLDECLCFNHQQWAHWPPQMLGNNMSVQQRWDDWFKNFRVKRLPTRFLAATPAWFSHSAASAQPEAAGASQNITRPNLIRLQTVSVQSAPIVCPPGCGSFPLKSLLWT